ncbi:peptidase [Salinivibrio proteolyticus]|nr:peptidase [Salinivibrio proteolyticus]
MKAQPAQGCIFKRFYHALWVLAIGWGLSVSPAWAVSYPLPLDGSRLVGYAAMHEVQEGEHLEAIAKQYDIGFLALLTLNPGVDPYLPEPSTLIKLPQQHLLPDTPYEGIVINLAELRLYYYPPAPQGENDATEQDPRVHIFPIGIGRIGRETPVMQTYVSQKRQNPTWTPPQSIREEYKRTRNIVLPDVVPAGPDNPLGHHALRLGYGNGEYLIHGTNKSFGIGLRVSAGCIRLRPDDVAWLFEAVDVNTPVRIIDTATKVSIEPDGRIMVEAHRPLSRTEQETQQRILLSPDPAIIAKLERMGISTRRYRAALAVQQGVPIEVAELSPLQLKAWHRLNEQGLTNASDLVRADTP